MEVTVKTAIEVGDVEREVELKFYCSPGEDASFTSPGGPAEAEFQSGFFRDTGEDCESFIDPTDYEEAALEQAAEHEAEAAEAKSAAEEARHDERRDGR